MDVRLCNHFRPGPPVLKRDGAGATSLRKISNHKLAGSLVTKSSTFEGPPSLTIFGSNNANLRSDRLSLSPAKEPELYT